MKNRESLNNMGTRPAVLRSGIASYQTKCIMSAHFLKNKNGVPIMAQQKQIRLGTMRLRVQSLASLIGLRIQYCCELRCSSQTWLRSGIAVALV